MRGRPKLTATVSNVPGGKRNYQRGAGAFLDGLMQDWGYGHVKDVIWDRYEVLERLPWTEGAFYSSWLRWFGGSNMQSQQMVQDGRYRSRHSNCKCKLTNYEGPTITNSFTWRFSSWSDAWERVKICKFLQINFFRLVVQFSEKLYEALYIGWHLYRNRNNFQNGA